VLVAKTPRGRQAEMCEYIVEEESLHGNFFDLKKKCKNMRKKCKSEKKCKENAKKNKPQEKCKTNAKKKQITKKNAKKMRQKCEKMQKNATQPEQQKQKAKKKENKGKKKGLTTEPPAGTSKNCSTPISKAKFVLKQKKSLSKNFPLAIFSL